MYIKNQHKLKKYSTSLAFKERQIKAAVRGSFFSVLIRLAMIKKNDNAESRRGNRHSLSHGGGSGNHHILSGRHFDSKHEKSPRRPTPLTS